MLDSCINNVKEVSVADSIDGIYIPKNLEECFAEIDKLWSDSIKQYVISITLEEFKSRAHMSTGLWIRNNWGLWAGSRLSLFFYKKGISHPDDMSGIILTSYYRKLKNERIRLRKQIKHYQEYWKNSRTSIVGKTKGGSKYYSIDSLLKHSDSIRTVELNGFSIFPKKIKKLKYLEEISFERCKGLDFDNSFIKLRHNNALKEVVIGECEMTELPESITEIKKLESLYFYSDSIMNLPDKLFETANIKALHFVECKRLNATRLFDQLRNTDSLKTLILFDVGLDSLPDISFLSNLCQLELPGNNLKTFPASIKNLRNLEELIIYGNQISEVSFTKNDLPKLKIINLSYNKFKDFPHSLSQLQSLKLVRIWKNQIPLELSKKINTMYPEIEIQLK